MRRRNSRELFVKLTVSKATTKSGRTRSIGKETGMADVCSLRANVLRDDERK
jgi:hypothetical protein